MLTAVTGGWLRASLFRDPRHGALAFSAGPRGNQQKVAPQAALLEHFLREIPDRAELRRPRTADSLQNVLEMRLADAGADGEEIAVGIERIGDLLILQLLRETAREREDGLALGLTAGEIDQQGGARLRLPRAP